jgi:hypothetical protein
MIEGGDVQGDGDGGRGGGAIMDVFFGGGELGSFKGMAGCSLCF